VGGRIVQLDSARELKSTLQESVIAPMATSPAVRSAGLQAQPMSALSATPPTIALGVTRRGRNDFGLAVRIQNRALQNSPQIATMTKRARGEVDIRYIGQVNKLAADSWHRQPTRPLRIGASIGHHLVTAGTLGGFIRDRNGGALLILSNNHVLANE